jgi:hypothetical protein
MSKKSITFAPDLKTISLTNKLNIMTQQQMKISDLESRYESRASFYGKAKVIDFGTKLSLISYNTEVAVYDKEKRELEIKASEYSNQGKYSQTTSRHIREFAAQTGVELKKVLVGTYNA